MLLFKLDGRDDKSLLTARKAEENIGSPMELVKAIMSHYGLSIAFLN